MACVFPPTPYMWPPRIHFSICHAVRTTFKLRVSQPKRCRLSRPSRLQHSLPRHLSPRPKAQDIRVTLYENDNFGGASMTFLASGTNTCFNIWGCFNDRTSSAKWSGFDDSSLEQEQLVLYDDADCKGTKYVVGISDIFSGVRNFGAAMNDKISSFSTFTTYNGIQKYTGYKCNARLGGNVTDAALEPIPV